MSKGIAAKIKKTGLDEDDFEELEELSKGEEEFILKKDMDRLVSYGMAKFKGYVGKKDMFRVISHTTYRFIENGEWSGWYPLPEKFFGFE